MAPWPFEMFLTSTCIVVVCAIEIRVVSDINITMKNKNLICLIWVCKFEIHLFINKFPGLISSH